MVDRATALGSLWSIRAGSAEHEAGTRGGVGMSIRRALASAMIGRYGVFALRAVSIVVLARLLTPDAYGHFAIATSLTALLWIVMDFGLGNYIVTRHERVDEAARRATGLAIVLTGVTLAVGLATIAALPASVLADEAKVAAYLAAACYLVYPLNLVPTAMLQSRLRFWELSAVDVAGTATQVSAAVVLALKGYGTAALAGGLVAEAAMRTLLLSGLFGRHLLVRPSFQGWREIVPFGRGHTISNGIHAAGEAASTFLLTGLLGPAAVGHFNRARTLITLADTAVFEGIAPVVLPALARELKVKGDLREAYVRKVAFLSLVHWSFFAVLALSADALVNVLLGPEWNDAAGLMQALAIMGLFMPFTQMSFKFYVALGLVGEYTRIQAAVQVARIALTAGGALHSIEAACLGYALGTYGSKAVFVVPGLKVRIGYRLEPLMREMARSAGVAAFASAGPMLLVSLGEPAPGPGALAAVLALAAVGWLAGVFATAHPAGEEILRAFTYLRGATGLTVRFRRR